MSQIDKYFRDEKLTCIPRKQAAKLDLFHYLSLQIAQAGDCFSEKEINAILHRFYDDYAILRRYLVDYGFLVRDQYGLEYRVTKETTMGEG